MNAFLATSSIMPCICFYPEWKSSADAPYIARHVGLRCGVPVPVPALTVNRLCGSGFQSIINGAQVSTSASGKLHAVTPVTND